MIPTATDVRVKDSLDSLDSRAMSIDATALTHLMSVLTNLYADPIAAVIREYSTNGYDATVEAGSAEPLRVTLPSAADPNFTVQDFGVGMSTDKILDHYSLYGRSDKRGTNAQVGSLGLGCKSALTYADTFTIESVHNGVRTVALVTKNDEGVGQIEIIDTASTSERNGTKITVPVRTYDVRDFTEKASTIYSYWAPGSVLVNGAAPSNALAGMTQAPGTNFYYSRPERYWEKSHVVVMGNVAYRVTSEYLSDFDQYNVVIVANIGDVSFAPSREELLYDTTTKRFLRDTVQAAKDSVAKHVDQVMATAQTHPEALTLFVENASLSFLSNVKWTFQGDDIPSALVESLAITYEPGNYRKKAFGECRVYAAAVPGTMFIHGFKAASVSAKIKAGMEDKYDDYDRFVFMDAQPKWAKWVEWHDWSDVKEAIKDVTPKSSGYTVQRNSRSGRIIDNNGNVSSWSEAASTKPDAEFCMLSIADLDEGTTLVRKCYATGIVPVLVYTREQSTFAEAFTTVKHAEVRTRFDEAVKAVSDEQYVGMALRDNSVASVLAPKRAEILDAEISAMLESVTQKEVKRSLLDYDRQVKARRKVDQMFANYPLLSGTHYRSPKAADAIAYINALYTYRKDSN